MFKYAARKIRLFLPQIFIDKIPKTLKKRISIFFQQEFNTMVSKLSYSKTENLIYDFKSNAWQSEEVAFNYYRSVNRDKYTQDAILNNSFNSILLKYLDKNMRLLDLGAGTGAVSEFLVQHVYKVHSAHISHQMLSHSKVRKTKNCQSVVTAGNKLAFRDESFDAIVSRMFLSHFTNVEDFLLESARVLKPNGLMIHHFTNESNLRLGLDLEKKDYYNGSTHTFLSNSSLLRNEKNALDFLSILEIDELVNHLNGTNLKLINRYPISFFNNNSIFKAISKDDSHKFDAELNKFLSNKKVYEFCNWIDSHLIESEVLDLSMWQVLIITK